MPAAKTFGELAQALSASWLQGPLSGGWVGIVHGYVQDALTTGLGLALRVGWVKESTVPVDALPHLGRNFGLPAYPIETPPQHIARMSNAWDLWSSAGHESPIESQLATLGFAGVQVLDPDETTILPAGYWSHFVVFFPFGSHPVTGPGPAWASFFWGDGTDYGPTGITPAQIETIRRVIRQWKPIDWICREIRFELADASIVTLNP